MNNQNKNLYNRTNTEVDSKIPERKLKKLRKIEYSEQDNSI